MELHTDLAAVIDSMVQTVILDIGAILSRFYPAISHCIVEELCWDMVPEIALELMFLMWRPE